MAVPRFDLHPRSGGDILDQAVRLYRRHFRPLLKLVLVPFPLNLLASIWMDSISSADRWMYAPRNVILWTVLLLLSVLVPSLASGAVARWVSNPVFPTTPDLWNCYRPALRRIVSLTCGCFLGFLLLPGGILLSAGGIGMLVMAAWAKWSGYTAVLAGLGILFLLWMAVAGIVVICRLSLFVMVTVLEDLGWRGAFRRSWRLISGQSWKALAIVLFSGAMEIGPVLLVNYVDQLSGGIIDPLAALLFSETVSLVLSPIGYMAGIFLYYDCRVGQEGLDLEMMAQNLGAPEKSQQEAFSLDR